MFDGDWGAGHLPRLVGELLHPFEVATADVNQGEPHEKSRQEGLLMQRASEIDSRLPHLDSGVPVSIAVCVFDGEFGGPELQG